MKNTLKAIAIVAGIIALVAAFVGVCLGANHLIDAGHGRLVAVTAAITGIACVVWIIKVDLDARDRARSKNMVIR